MPRMILKTLFVLLFLSASFCKCQNLDYLNFNCLNIILFVCDVDLAIATVASDSSLSCYVCDDCPQPFNPNATGVTIKSGCTTCQKICYNKTVHRTCADSTSECYGGLYFGCKVCESDYDGKYDITICCNDKNLCNDAQRPSGSPLAMVTVLVGMLVLRKLIN